MNLDMFVYIFNTRYQNTRYQKRTHIVHTHTRSNIVNICFQPNRPAYTLWYLNMQHLSWPNLDLAPPKTRTSCETGSAKDLAASLTFVHTSLNKQTRTQTQC